ncbi:MAG: DUF1674 domain-containing protein [Rhodospirillales bacterium]|nr:DUF1674 domain-containing protein [Rhodospirillales bacterium]
MNEEVAERAGEGAEACEAEAPRTAIDAARVPADDGVATAPARDRPGEEERGGPKGPEPTRYGDWERKGRCIDF